MKFSVHRTMLLVIVFSLVAALLPAGMLLDARLTTELREKARRDLETAPILLADRNRTAGEALGMRARDLAGGASLRSAVQRGNVGTARRILAAQHDSLVAEMILAGPRGEPWAGPFVGDTMIASALVSSVIVEYRMTDGGLRRVALAPVPAPAESISASLDRGEVSHPSGVAGLTLDVGSAYAVALAGLSRSEVLILDRDGVLVAASGDSASAEVLARGVGRVSPDGSVHTVNVGGDNWWVSGGALDGAGRVLFARRSDDELGVLPELRRGGVFAVIFALGVALVVGGIFARSVGEPVEALARAADRLAGGDHDSPVRRSRILEVDRVGQAFIGMRESLAAKMGELEQVNRELEARQERLKILQAEMIRRDRLTASGRLVAELAHEIRNPVASIRNCLEIVRRKLADEDREFADMAIDELLRMHELAEHVLDLNRPVGTGGSTCDPTRVAANVGELVGASSSASGWTVIVEHPEVEVGSAGIPQDALKQVLLNLVENAREAMPGGGTISIRVSIQGEMIVINVLDRGPGIPPDVLPNIFDAFFTTKGEVRGVGLGLFIADGIVRRYGGSIVASNRPDGPGADFRIELTREPGP